MKKEKIVKNKAAKLTKIVNSAIIKEYRNGKLYKKRSTNNNGQSKIRNSLPNDRLRSDPQWDRQSLGPREQLYRCE